VNGNEKSEAEWKRKRKLRENWKATKRNKAKKRVSIFRLNARSKAKRIPFRLILLRSEFLLKSETGAPFSFAGGVYDKFGKDDFCNGLLVPP
jgi:hypothetical protein